jgi:predicted transcriptional regulator
MAWIERLQQELADYPVREGLSPTDVLELPDAVRVVINKIMRQNEMEANDLAADLGLSEAEMHAVGAALVAKGLLTVTERAGHNVYRARLMVTRKRNTTDLSRLL